ncbi:MAG TPA: hypothetical protein VH877_22340 [Polyangia bacterium]|jgi:hypothetical protein|nr:hypothetical protein [Polyangia bacterium]
MDALMALTDSTLTITRRGEFRTDVVGPNHCGLRGGIFRYTIRVECEGASLDQRGFLFDHQRIGEFFARGVLTDLSCERLAQECGQLLLDVIARENPGCKVNRMWLTIAPDENAEVTLEWPRRPPVADGDMVRRWTSG